tara:strand:- start:1428 stop:1820 length:393 start_codon:yes stop_codon:yes gene_type:complete
MAATDKATAKEERFAQLVVELGNQSEAYRQAYNSTAKQESVAVEASKLANKPNVALMIADLKQLAQKAHGITMESLLKELEEARTIAATCETPQASAMVSASMSKAKLLGMDKQIIETTLKVQDSGENPW